MDAGSSPVLWVLINKLIYSFMVINEFYYILLFLVLSFIISCVVFFLSYFLVFQNYDTEKMSIYECGFQPFEDSRSKFDIKFYLVAILFIIFDLEISFLFPWSVYIFELDFYAYWSMFFFLFILTIGFVYEWMKGALNWD